MLRAELRFPILAIDISEYFSKDSPLNFHSMINGKSPSATIQLTWANCSAYKGLFSKANGDTRGGTGNKNKKKMLIKNKSKNKIKYNVINR